MEQLRTVRLTSRIIFPLPERPKFCWAREQLAPAKIERRTESASNIARPYYICTTCDNGKFNIFRDSRYPRGFNTWDDGIGIYPQNSRCFCGLPSRQDWKGEKARVKGFGEEFWACASGALILLRQEGWSSFDDAGNLLDDLDDFHPNLLKDVPTFC